ncbi:hypothetical protein NDU88_006965 [Pleurodeles waltl]|uniref:Uncharacterized protein n=1 Tax=Pleurodeles waltl TaxID=8319 RepID=A0AAV7NRR9_PLEWA|nr:hypothetical protein NDU88_006965 [Pleurodeles waltl]
MARSHGPFRTGDYETCITADFSKETNNRRPRLSKAKLIARQECRGLGLPSIAHYVLALHSLQLAFMLQDVSDPPLWLKAEGVLLTMPPGL